MTGSSVPPLSGSTWASSSSSRRRREKSSGRTSSADRALPQRRTSCTAPLKGCVPCASLPNHNHPCLPPEAPRDGAMWVSRRSRGMSTPLRMTDMPPPGSRARPPFRWERARWYHTPRVRLTTTSTGEPPVCRMRDFALSPGAEPPTPPRATAKLPGLHASTCCSVRASLGPCQANQSSRQYSAGMFTGACCGGAASAASWSPSKAMAKRSGRRSSALPSMSDAGDVASRHWKWSPVSTRPRVTGGSSSRPSPCAATTCHPWPSSKLHEARSPEVRKSPQKSA
mmetsp:Transcript_14742/g.35807  ORF Transcript_14742/g.35807 Transcript_14742/m.35807 type:complete len:283 (-) Transcript_14742:730-1578(-)